ncbi:VWA domain-containing protein [Psychromarinibacter sp. C21-152]|uniref:VWA domain-containing protein n=1 Tax=Psychromarinibacter sediminicola TaxID=3033385 RepID=A0AAE3TA28_9RHOB|nr:VWA domain-containing protein [Psychromarinibacter sediminicola]MDF0602423.1 VWA domain-containing protein [Psychromarinibacter sediminicola]
MTRIHFEPWEPEETVGKLWHSFASRLDAPEAHEGAAVDLSEVGGRLAVLFRGLGGSPSVELRPVSEEISHHRLSWRRRLGTEAETAPRASFDGEVLRLPARLAVFPAREANAALYLWLAAAAAHAPDRLAEDDPLRADLRALRAARAMVADTLADAPGLAGLYEALSEAVAMQRPARRLPAAEAQVESVLRHMLGEPLPEAARPLWEAMTSGDLSGVTAPRGYRPFRPVPLWPELREIEASARHETEDTETGEGEPETETEEGKAHRAKRKKSDQAERSDSFILHKFEAILSWAEFMNLNRRVDDDPDNARKAADDQEEIGLGQISKAPPTKLKLHLDLAPEDVDRERLSAEITYPEWDARSGAYLPDHACVFASVAEPAEDAHVFRDPAAARRIRAVKRQFEALRPGRVTTRGHLDGDALDIEAAVRAETDRRANGEGTERVWMQTRPQARDLAVSILLDVSRSTESAVTGRAVIDIEREALDALALGLDACGDDFAIHAFSSLKRSRVYVQTCKSFAEPMGPMVERRLATLRPGFYTRMGAAIRHVSAELAQQSRKRRLLIVITDGKPNDLDHYEGRHGIEDTAMAVREARRAGQSVFGVTVDRTGKAWFPRLFGQGGFAVIPDPEKLIFALPQIYRHLVGA